MSLEMESQDNESETQPISPAARRSLRLSNDGAGKSDEALPSGRNLESIFGELNDLRQICSTRVSALENARATLIAIAENVAEQVAQAGLTGEDLPRGYLVLENDRTLYLLKIKCQAQNEGEEDLSDPTEEEQPSLFVFTGQDDSFVRLTLGSAALNVSDLAVFYKDLQDGFLREITAQIMDRLGEIENDLSHLPVPKMRGKHSASEKQASSKTSQRLQLEDLGRSRK